VAVLLGFFLRNGICWNLVWALGCKWRHAWSTTVRRPFGIFGFEHVFSNGTYTSTSDTTFIFKLGLKLAASGPQVSLVSNCVFLDSLVKQAHRYLCSASRMRFMLKTLTCGRLGSPSDWLVGCAVGTVRRGGLKIPCSRPAVGQGLSRQAFTFRASAFST
jgi:hypothetical protein